MGVGHGTDDNCGRSYRARMTKTGNVITRTRHIKTTNIYEGYLQHEMTKSSQTLAVNRLNELVDHFTQFHKSN